MLIASTLSGIWLSKHINCYLMGFTVAASRRSLNWLHFTADSASYFLTGYSQSIVKPMKATKLDMGLAKKPSFPWTELIFGQKSLCIAVSQLYIAGFYCLTDPNLQRTARTGRV